MSQGSAGEAAMTSDTPMQMGGQVQPVDTEGTMNGFTAVNGRTSPPSQTAKQPVAETGRDDTSHPPREPSQRPNVDGVQAHAYGEDSQMGTPSINGHLKRKRSIDDGQSSEASDRSSASPHTASPDDQMQDSSAYNRPNEDHSELAWNGQPGDESAEHLRMLAPIQHENQQHVNGAYGSQLPNGQSNGMRPGYHKDESTGLITTNAGVQMDPKKRKRAFTNRTKTGCQTCRRRKKKCDEAKPECNNCTRGGFRCEGYTPRVSWPPDNKAKGPKQALPPGQSLPPTPRELQDLSGNLHPRPPPRPETQQYVDIPPQGHMRPRPLSIDDDQDRNMSNGWHQSPYAQSHRGYPMEHKDPVHGLPTHGMRDSYDRPISSMSGSSMHNMHPMQHMPPQPSPGIIGMAQQALGTHRIQPVMQPPTTPYANNPAVSNQHRMMWSGELYEHASSPLQRDREKCARLLHSFNRDSDLNYAKRMEDFDHILQLPHPSQINDPSSQARSRRGNMCVVDAPFRCEYGYNLRLGEHVTIESGCHISDPREVVIDSHSYIGPGVKILGKVLPLDPSIRANGIVSQARGFEIHIGQQVYIGANCVIQPDEELCKNGRLEIGNGSYIKPGSVVNKNVQPGVIYGPPGCDVISGVPMHPGAASGLAKGRSR